MKKDEQENKTGAHQQTLSKLGTGTYVATFQSVHKVADQFVGLSTRTAGRFEQGSGTPSSGV